MQMLHWLRLMGSSFNMEGDFEFLFVRVDDDDDEAKDGN